MTKSELRKLYLEKRAGLSASAVAMMSTAVTDTFFFTINPAAFTTLHCYLPFERFNEPDTKLIFQRIWQEFPELTTTVPRIDFSTGELTSVVYSSTCPVMQNKWGVNEPEGSTVVHPEAIDVAIVPLLCFDERGYRVGYGKGFYDRFLAKCRPNCHKIGLSFFAPVSTIDDIDEYDIPLDICITTDQTFNFPK